MFHITLTLLISKYNILSDVTQFTITTSPVCLNCIILPFCCLISSMYTRYSRGSFLFTVLIGNKDLFLCSNFLFFVNLITLSTMEMGFALI